MLKTMYRNRFLFSFIIALLVLFNVSNTQAQAYKFGQGWSLGVSVGTTKFHGDLSDAGSSFMNKTPFSSYFYKERRLAGLFIVEKAISPYWGIRGMVLKGTLESSKLSENAYFEANYFDYTLSLTLDFTNIFLGAEDIRDYRLYGFVGMGLSHSSTLKYDMTSGKIISGRQDQKNMVESVGPIGLGFSLFSSQIFSINFESSLHIVHTTKLDRTPVPETKFEAVGFISLGIVYNFLPGDGSVHNRNSYTGRSDDASIRAFNKRRRVVMRTSQNHKAFKKKRRKRR